MYYQTPYSSSQEEAAGLYRIMILLMLIKPHLPIIDGSMASELTPLFTLKLTKAVEKTPFKSWTTKFICVYIMLGNCSASASPCDRSSLKKNDKKDNLRWLSYN